MQLRRQNVATSRPNHSGRLIDVVAALLYSFLFSSVFFFSTAAADSSSYNPNQRYCFRFTWIGPKYNNVFQNATCDDIVGEKARVPCTRPLYATDNGNLPNTTLIWDRHRSNVSDIACRLSPSDVCVKYTYRFNHAVENITYLCSKVRIENEGTAPSMCFTEFQDGREIEVCACESQAGLMPCNAAAGVGWGANHITRVALVWLAVFGVCLAPLDFLIGG